LNGRPAVVVTGASSGIGAATVARLAADGYTVFAGVRNDEDAQRLTGISRVVPLHLDVADERTIREAANAVQRSGLPLGGLVNNAGIAIAGPLEHLPISEIRRQFEVNVFGALAVTQAMLPMLRLTRARIVFVGSISGRLPVPYLAPYSASKAALRTVASALRVELRPIGIRVTLIEPGSVRTPIWRKGRHSVREVASAFGPEAVRAYGESVQAMVRMAQREEDSGIPAERVAEAIAEALETTRPRAEHLIGPGARAGSILALLPTRVRERIIAHSLRLPRHR
jgi:NAD(P)-dependent dehydrogenase (short-subunit alcohol dehydrogenase family)